MFSELCDAVQTRSGRPGQTALANIKAYALSTMHELNMLSLFEKDLIEDQLTAATDNYIWPVPRDFREMRTVQYPDGSYPSYVQPGKRQADFDIYFYRAGNYFVFSGTAEANIINIAYYTKTKFFTYYAADGNVRPAIYDRAADTWTYLSGGVYVGTLGTTELDEAAEALVSNWILKDWYTVVEEGALAKLYKNIGDDRALSSFALYKSFQNTFMAGEVHAASGF